MKKSWVNESFFFVSVKLKWYCELWRQTANLQKCTVCIMKMRQNVIQAQIMHYENKKKGNVSTDSMLGRQNPMYCEALLSWQLGKAVQFWWQGITIFSNNINPQSSALITLTLFICSENHPWRGQCRQLVWLWNLLSVHQQHLQGKHQTLKQPFKTETFCQCSNSISEVNIRHWNSLVRDF